MGQITISSVTYSIPVSGTQYVNIYIKSALAPDIPASYTLVGSNVPTDAAGTFFTPFVISGLVDGDSYTVKIQVTCGGAEFQEDVQAGTVPSTTTTTTTTSLPAITGTLAVNCDDGGCTHQDSTDLIITLDSPAPANIDLLIGEVHYQFVSGTYIGSGTAIFALPPIATLDTYPANPTVPFKVTIPMGSSGLTIAGPINRSGFVGGTNTWICHSCQFPTRSLYVKVDTPGYVAGFSTGQVGLSVYNV